MRIALGFWGITRSLKYTIDSINKHIFTPLKQQNIEYIIYIHTFSINSEYNNLRTGELNIYLNNEEYKLLNPNFIKIDDQDKVKNSINITQYESQPDPWGTNYNSVENFICAMYSKNELTKMIEESNEQFDYVIFLRPDVKYLNPLNINSLNHVKDNVICVPNFCLFHEFNDRFAMTNMYSYKIYGTLFNELLEYSKTKMLHSEECQAYLLKKQNFRIVLIPFYFNRVRFNGFELKDDTINEFKPKVVINYHDESINTDTNQNVLMSLNKDIDNNRKPSMGLFIN